MTRRMHAFGVALGSLALGVLAAGVPARPAAAQGDVPGEVIARQDGLVVSRIRRDDGARSVMLVTNTAEAPRCGLIQYRHNGMALDSPPTQWLRYEPGSTGRLSIHVVRRGEPQASQVRLDVEPTMCTPLANAGRVVFQPNRKFESQAYLAASGAVSPSGEDIALIEWQTGQLCRYRMGTPEPAWCTSNFPDMEAVRTAGVAFAPDGGPIVTARAITTRTASDDSAATRKRHTAVLTGYARDGGDEVFRHEIRGIRDPRTVTGAAAGKLGDDGALRGVLAHAPPPDRGKPGALHIVGRDGAVQRIATEGYRPLGVAVVRGGEALAAWSGERVTVYDATTLKPQRTHTLQRGDGGGAVTASAISPDGTRLAVARRGRADDDPRLALYDVAQGSQLWSRPIPAPSNAFADNLALHPDGGEVLVSLSNNSGYLLDSETGTVQFGMTEASPWAYFPDGARILMLSVDLVWRPDRPLPGGG